MSELARGVPSHVALTAMIASSLKEIAQALLHLQQNQSMAAAGKNKIQLLKLGYPDHVALMLLS